MAHEYALPMVFQPRDFGGTSDRSLLATAYKNAVEPDDSGILCLDPDVWPVSLAAQIVVRNKAYSWVIYPSTSSYHPGVTHPVSAAARTRSVTCPLKAAILNGTTYTLPISNSMYGAHPSGRIIQAGVQSSGAEGPEGNPNNYYTMTANGTEVLSSGLSYSATSGNYRVNCTGVSLSMEYGFIQGDVDPQFDRTLPINFSFIREGAAYTSVTGVKRVWKAVLFAAMWFSGTWTNYEYYGGTWNQTGTGSYSARKSYVARYRRQLAITESEDFNPIGAFDYHSTPTFPATSVLFDLQRNDVFSVTGKTF